MGVAKDYQNKGVGARLKWAQRAKAISEGRDFISGRDPMQARNAHFNLNRLGVTVRHYEENFCRIDYNVDQSQPPGERPGLPSDRLFASWDLNSPRVTALAAGNAITIDAQPVKTIAIPTYWSEGCQKNTQEARDEQTRVRTEFQSAFAENRVRRFRTRRRTIAVSAISTRRSGHDNQQVRSLRGPARAEFYRAVAKPLSHASVAARATGMRARLPRTSNR